MIGFEVNRGRRGIRRGEVLSYSAASGKAFVTLDGSLSAVELPIGQWLPPGLLTTGAKVAVMLFDENNPADGVIVGAYGGGALPVGAGLSWITFNEYLGANFSGWTWATDTGVFSGAPSTVNRTTMPGLLRLFNSTTMTRHFAYKAGSKGALNLRCAKGRGVITGLRLDDGTNSNYVEIALMDDSGGKFKIQTRISGGSPADIVTGLPASFLTLRLAMGGTWTFAYYSIDTPYPQYVATVGTTAWTVARWGLLHEQNIGNVINEHESLMYAIGYA